MRQDKAGTYIRGRGEPTFSYLDRIMYQLEFLESTSRIHTGWYTHKNHHGCWVCDTLLLARALYREFRQQASIYEDVDAYGTERPDDENVQTPVEEARGLGQDEVRSEPERGV